MHVRQHQHKPACNIMLKLDTTFERKKLEFCVYYEARVYYLYDICTRKMSYIFRNIILYTQVINRLLRKSFQIISLACNKLVRSKED